MLTSAALKYSFQDSTTQGYEASGLAATQYTTATTTPPSPTTTTTITTTTFSSYPVPLSPVSVYLSSSVPLALRPLPSTLCPSFFVFSLTAVDDDVRPMKVWRNSPLTILGIQPPSKDSRFLEAKHSSKGRSSAFNHLSVLHSALSHPVDLPVCPPPYATTSTTTTTFSSSSLTSSRSPPLAVQQSAGLIYVSSTVFPTVSWPYPCVFHYSFNSHLALPMCPTQNSLYSVFSM